MPTSFRLPKAAPPNTPKPPWLKTRAPLGPSYAHLKSLLAESRLATVCQNARCPNLGECWSSGTATVMLMGDICTRACKFCHIATGVPAPLEAGEAEALVGVVEALQLRYVVVTSVDRDDLPDGGAAHFARAIGRLREACPQTQVEVLLPDFQGKEAPLKVVAKAGAAVLAHNLETVARLSPFVRDRRASYNQSLEVLRCLKREGEGALTKSSLMVGLGESDAELAEAMEDLREAGVALLTLGQYLQPSPRHLPVERFVPPETFEAYARQAEALGFLHVASGPLVRSSYKAAVFLRGLAERGEG